MEGEGEGEKKEKEGEKREEDPPLAFLEDKSKVAAATTTIRQSLASTQSLQ